MPSKRDHSKSRLGCRQCKQRRIKCDEVAPCCGPCAKKGIECDYKEFAGAANSIQVMTQANYAESSRRREERMRSQSISSDSSTATTTSSHPSFTAHDMLLMHKYSLETSLTIDIVDEDDDHDLWQCRLPVLALHFPFLMHALLSVTAVHRGMLDVSRYHYGKAIGSFNASGPATTPAQAEAVFCYCVLIMVITMALECAYCPENNDPVSGVLDFFGVTRTSVPMLSAILPAVTNPIINELVVQLNEMPDPSPLPDALVASLDNLEALIQHHYTGNTAATQACAALCDALRSLRHVLSLVTLQPDTYAYVLQWAVAVSPAYIALLRHGDAAARAIFAHWCIPVHHAPARWFVGDWPRRAIIRIAGDLTGTGWQQAITWPVSCLHEGY